MDEKLTVEPGTRRKETPPRTWRFWFLAFFLQYLLLWATGTGTLILLWPIYSLRYPSSFDISFVEIVLRNILDPLDFLLFGPARLLLIWIVIAAFLKWFGSGFINFFVPRGLFGSVSNTVDALAGVNQVLIDRRDLAPNEVLFTNRQMVMSQIDNRINSLRNRTGLILISIGLSIIVAATIVIFAGRLTSIDATAVSRAMRGSW